MGIRSARGGKTGVVKILLSLDNQNKPDINEQDKNGFNALMYATYYADVNLIKVLLSANPLPNLNATNKNGQSARMIAIQQKHTHIAQLLQDAELKVAAIPKPNAVSENEEYLSEPVNIYLPIAQLLKSPKSLSITEKTTELDSDAKKDPSKKI